MAPTAKLTKRQKKGIAFRERKHRTSKDEALDTPNIPEDEIDVRELEHQTLATPVQDQQVRQVSEEAVVRRGKPRTEDREEAETQVVVAKKRKRKAGEEAKRTPESSEPKPKRRRGSDGSALDDMEELVEDHIETGETEREGEGEKTKQRFILFLGTIFFVRPILHISLNPPHSPGNLKYTTTPEAIQAHFSICGMWSYGLVELKCSDLQSSSTHCTTTYAQAIYEITHENCHEI